MKTTLNLDDELLRRANRRAAAQGKTPTAPIEDGLRVLVEPSSRQPSELNVPTFRGDGPSSRGSGRPCRPLRPYGGPAALGDVIAVDTNVSCGPTVERMQQHAGGRALPLRAGGRGPGTKEDLRRVGELLQDLGDAEIMAKAWE